MKRNIKAAIINTTFIACVMLLNGCAFIIGGASYDAQVKVVGSNKTVKIYREDTYIGNNTAIIDIKRREANSLLFKIEAEGCEPKEYAFTSRRFRTGAFICSILFFTSELDANNPNTFFPLPLGAGVDLISGAVWKPNVNEPNIYKKNLNNYIYSLDYSGCNTVSTGNSQTQIEVPKQSKQEKILELNQLLKDGLITQEEYDKAKMDILSK